MATLMVQLTEQGDVFAVDVGPGLPIPKSLSFEYRASSEVELRAMVDALGGVAAFDFSPKTGSASRWAVPVTRDGERVATARVMIGVDESLHVPTVEYPAVAALAEERAELEHRDRLEAV